MKFKEQDRNRYTAQEKDNKAEQRQVKNNISKTITFVGDIVQC